jgi:hypothetical protein
MIPDDGHFALELLDLLPDVDDQLSRGRDVAELVLEMRNQLPGAVHLLVNVLRIVRPHRALKPGQFIFIITCLNKSLLILNKNFETKNQSVILPQKHSKLNLNTYLI